MPAINTISQDFCLFESDESSFDYPLFSAAKTMKTAAPLSASLNFFNNPLCTPQTPSLDLTSNTVSAEGFGFDSCAAFFDDAATALTQQQLIDTPFSSYMDTPLLSDTPYETPFLTDFSTDAQMDLDIQALSPLFDDFDFAFSAPATVEPQQVSFKPSDNVTSLSPVSTVLSSAPTSPAESIENDFSDDDEFVPSRSAALVSGLKRKVDSATAVGTKKHRTIDPAKKAAAPKRFTCIQSGCDKSFARLFNLHTHEKTHDPEKARPFNCSDSTCGKSFSRKHDLQRHEASVHKGERNFVCENCTKSFARQDGLRRHLAVKGPCFDNQWSAT
ncbi:hypothetical protein BGZ65_011647 [Modicella reniformis]|uniref:C2H2-type domain-containing protein n=1 Tax=Modicella reniformis TaxID=1440133 RepID=A0A9P6IPB4_9FUNG|nr:hypothetical protein BGZ65_011647 [Modicella reniformis]